MAGLVLAAGDDSLSDWADGKALLYSCVAGGPLGGDRLEVRPVNFGLNGVRPFGPNLGRLAGLQVGHGRQERYAPRGARRLVPGGSETIC